MHRGLNVMQLFHWKFTAEDKFGPRVRKCKEDGKMQQQQTVALPPPATEANQHRLLLLLLQVHERLDEIENKYHLTLPPSSTSSSSYHENKQASPEKCDMKQSAHSPCTRNRKLSNGNLCTLIYIQGLLN
jgi:hypothetical protein